MKIIISRHAKRQMKWRKITENEVISIINEPDTVADTVKQRKNAFKMVYGRLVKVTYKPKDDSLIVITAMGKRE